MASIVKRKKKYSVVYTYTDENGNKRQKWETFETNAEAKKRKLQVEYEQESGTFIPPSAKTVNDLLDEYTLILQCICFEISVFTRQTNIKRQHLTLPSARNGSFSQRLLVLISLFWTPPSSTPPNIRTCLAASSPISSSLCSLLEHSSRSIPSLRHRQRALPLHT